MSKTFKNGKEAMEFAKENGIITNMKELRKLKDEVEDDAVVVNDFKYSFVDRNIILEDISGKDRLPYPVYLIKRQGSNGLRFTKYEVQSGPTGIQGVSGCNWGQPINPDAEKRWANGNISENQNSWGQSESSSAEITNVFTVNELSAPIVFSRRETTMGVYITVTIDLPFGVKDSERDLAYAVRSYCLALTKEASSGEDIEYIINKLFKEGFIYEDKKLLSTLTAAYTEADLFCMMNNADLLSVVESKSVGFGNGGGWGCNAPTHTSTGYKNIYRLRLTLKEGN